MTIEQINEYLENHALTSQEIIELMNEIESFVDLLLDVVSLPSTEDNHVHKHPY